MGNGATKVTVVIPTRCRPDTLAKSLQTAINQDYPNLEIVVSDNFSGDSTESVVCGANDPRVRYLNTGRRISMAENFEFAISTISDGWIVVIGDDDGLVRNSLSRVIPRLEQSGLKALASRSCFFFWPNRRQPGRSILSVPMRRRYEIRSSRQYLKKTLNGDIGYPDLPMLYTGGIIHHSVFDQIRSVKGKFFQSMAPDSYSAVAISSFLDRYLFSYEPFAIAGASAHSTGAAWSGKIAVSDVAHQFYTDPNIPQHSRIPYNADGSIPQSMHAVLYENYLKSSYLHGDFAKVRPDRQLQVYLATGGVAGVDLTPWCRRFAELNSIDFNAVQHSFSTWLVSQRIRFILGFGLLANVLERFRVDSKFQIEIEDVEVASDVAQTILRLRPNRIKSHIHFLSRMLDRTVENFRFFSSQG